MFCSNCGANQPDDTRFCANCGAAIAAPAAAAAAPAQPQYAPPAQAYAQPPSTPTQTYAPQQAWNAPEPGAAAPVGAVENLLGLRIVAGLIDSVIFIVIYFVFVAMFGESDSSGSSFNTSLTGGAALIYFGLAIAYWVGLEATTGQTLGKKVMGIKVVSDTFGPMTWGKSIIRNLLRIVDGLPFLYIVGIICISSSQKHQRVGDMAAGTLVVRV